MSCTLSLDAPRLPWSAVPTAAKATSLFEQTGYPNRQLVPGTKAVARARVKLFLGKPAHLC
jgi:hypothetical protein